MSSDLYFYDNNFYHHSSPEITGDLFFPDPFFPFCDYDTNIFQEFSNDQNTRNTVHNSNSLDKVSPNILSSSPPNHQLENLSIYQTTPLQPPENCSNSASGYGNFSGLDAFGVKTEECQMGFDSSSNNNFFMPHSYSGVENVAKFMQRSYSSNYFGGKPDFVFQPGFDTLLESPNYQNQALSSPENTYLAGQLRRVCSTGDLKVDTTFNSPLFCDSATNIFQEFSNNQNTQNSVHNSNSLDKFSPNILSSSPPSHQLENLSLYQTTPLQPLENCSNSANGYGNFSGLDASGVKTEDCQMGFDSSYNNNFFLPHSYSGVENVAKFMQRSYSSNYFEGKPDFLFQPRLESPNYQNQALSSPENTFLAGQLRRVCSTGDLQNIRTTQRSFSSPLATESSFMEEANFKVGRYSAEERKDRISKYRAKRNQRNFTKTIKYACRKTLADNRPRIRGRFARNDEIGEIPKASCSTRQEDADVLWFDGVEEHGGIRGGEGREERGDFINSYGQAHQFQYYSY